MIEALEAENIESRPIWKPMHMQPYYRDCDFISARELRSVSEEIFANGVCLSSDTKLTDDDLVRIVKTIRRLWDW